MGITFRADAEVVNGTAGTSVTVSKPAGTADDDVLVAFISEVGAGSITPPAGWTLIGSRASGSGVTEACYYRVASSEGASWTWTLGASVRNWGWVGAYIGVNADDPVVDAYSETAFLADLPDLLLTPVFSGLPHWWAVLGSAVVRTASGSATTWDLSSVLTSRSETSTNGGSGTDIAGVVGDAELAIEYVRVQVFAAATSQDQAACATWMVLLRPAFTAFDGGLLEPVAEIEIDGVWEDISEFVRNSPPVQITKGRANATSVAAPTRITLVLDNDDGRFADDDPTGPYWPHFGLGNRLRVSVPYGYDPPTERATAFIDSIEPGWDLSTRDAVVAISASGRLRRLQRGEEPLRPALQFAIGGSGRLGVPPAAYWTFQDGSNSTVAASEVGGPPVIVTGVTFSADSSLAGSSALARLSTGATLSGVVPVHTNAGSWIFGLFLKIPAIPLVGDTVLFDLSTTGTAHRWRVDLVPGSPDLLRATAYDSAGASAGTVNFAITEADVYDQWTLFVLGVETNGSDVDYHLNYFSDTGLGTSATLTSRTHGIVSAWSLTCGSFLDQAGIGHCFYISHPDFEVSADYLGFGFAMSGNDNETSLTRVERLAQEAGEPLAEVPNLSETPITMGPQPASTFVAAAREAEEVGRALLHDGGPGGDLVWLPRSWRYNADVRMTLDMAQEQLAPPFRPVRDDQLIRNDWTISRSGGSSARAKDDESIASKGRYKDSRALNLYDDTHLPHLAAWRVNEGTTAAKRYPGIAGDLRKSPELAEEWLNCRIGARIKAVNLMSQHPSVIDADVFIEGYTETISTDVWGFGINSSPAEPYTVGVLDDDILGKLDSASSSLTDPVDDTETSISVTTTVAADLWTTSAGEMPIPVLVGGEEWTVTAISGASSPQTFTVTRSVNGVVKSHAAGTEVHVKNAIRLAL